MAFFLLLFWGEMAFSLRIVSLVPSVTEILYALGLEEEIVGVDTYSDYPPQVKEKEKVGGFAYPNLEKIVFLKPDLVFASDIIPSPVLGQLRNLGIKVKLISPQSLEELFNSLKEIGFLTGKEKEARALVSKLRGELKKIEGKVSPLPLKERPKVCLLLWDRPLWVAGPHSFVGELIEKAGGVNILQGVKKPYVTLNPEILIQKNPEIIIIASHNGGNLKERIERISLWKNLKAVREGRVYGDINPDLVLRPGPRCIRGIEELWERFYGGKKWKNPSMDVPGVEERIVPWLSIELLRKG